MLTVGLPEFPPCVSAVVTKSKGVFRSSEDFAVIHVGGSLKGSSPVACF